MGVRLCVQCWCFFFVYDFYFFFHHLGSSILPILRDGKEGRGSPKVTRLE